MLKSNANPLLELQKLDKEISSILKNSFEIPDKKTKVKTKEKTKEKTLLRKLNGMKRTRVNITQTIDQFILTRYEKLRGHKGETGAVVPVVNGICQGCFINVSTATFVELQRKDVAAICDHCGRFIYYLQSV